MKFKMCYFKHSGKNVIDTFKSARETSEYVPCMFDNRKSQTLYITV